MSETNVQVDVIFEENITAQIQEFNNCTVTASNEVFVSVPQPTKYQIITVEMPGSQGPRGEKGDKGDRGADGKDAVVASIPKSRIDILF